MQSVKNAVMMSLNVNQKTINKKKENEKKMKEGKREESKRYDITPRNHQIE